ncbi:MAG: UDP-glucose 4-epimerase GalE [Parcubacteria group bacterium]|nr:UDP-glucose 4-epimerase GalE [Parcubacteria group bacterium]
MTVLVTGGLGFIGSHTVVELVNHGCSVLILDDTSNSSLKVLDNIRSLCEPTKVEFVKGTILDDSILERAFESRVIDTVMHFAAFKSVKESMTRPLDYYENNVYGTLKLLQHCKKYNIRRFVFSSSATVYGSSPSPLSESSQIGTGITNPYGRSKYISEKLINDFATSSNTECIILRYFNPVGAHPSGLIGEDPHGIPNNLMPFLLRVAQKNHLDPHMDNIYASLSILGNDYNTPDGTCIRDFIHVVDLAKAHVAAYAMASGNGLQCEVFNIGTGKGTSVLELVSMFVKTNGLDIPFVFEERRNGDLESVYCQCKKANRVLNWKAERTVEDIVKDSWHFIQKRSS